MLQDFPLGCGIAFSLVGVLRKERFVLKKILIVDDSPAEIKLMQAVLDAAGYWSVAINDPLQIEQLTQGLKPTWLIDPHAWPGRLASSSYWRPADER